MFRIWVLGFSSLLLLILVACNTDGEVRYKSKNLASGSTFENHGIAMPKPGPGAAPQTPAPAPAPTPVTPTSLPNPPADTSNVTNPFVSALPNQIAALDPKCTTPTSISGCVEALNKLYAKCAIPTPFPSTDSFSVGGTVLRGNNIGSLNISNSSITISNSMGNLAVTQSPTNGIVISGVTGLTFVRASMFAEFTAIHTNSLWVTAPAVARIPGTASGNICLQTGNVGISLLDSVGTAGSNGGQTLVVMGMNSLDGGRATAVTIRNVVGDVILLNANVTSITNVGGKVYSIKSVVGSTSGVVGGVF